MTNDATSRKPWVLLVDDNEIHRYAINKSLQNANFEVMVAHTGHQALLLANMHKPDVVLLDIHLPDVNGFEVCSRLQADPQTKPIPIVFHSATTGTKAAQSYADSLGASAFLTYPVDTDHLVVTLRGVLARARNNATDTDTKE